MLELTDGRVSKNDLASMGLKSKRKEGNRELDRLALLDFNPFETAKEGRELFVV
jgi:hypothetical protein